MVGFETFLAKNTSTLPTSSHFRYTLPVTFFQLDSQVQNYEWGSTKRIAEYLGYAPNGNPEAELWMGAHPRCPSRLTHPMGDIDDLKKLIEDQTTALLGPQAASQWGRLPFLFKLLAAEKPLSLQAHPELKQALRGFQRENEARIPLNSSKRNYKDASPKPELIYAITEFHALSGFRKATDAIQMTSSFGCAHAGGQLQVIWERFNTQQDSQGLEIFFRSLFQLPSCELKSAIARAATISTTGPLSYQPAQRLAPWLLKLAQLHPSDPGVLAVLLVNLVTLQPGQAMFLPAGNLHAYLDGFGFELMANSDNVMRGGLTSKHVDVDELCEILAFEPFCPCIQRGKKELLAEGIESTAFSNLAPEFQLSILDIKTKAPFAVSGPEIWLVVDGEITMSDEVTTASFRRGNQLFISASGKSFVTGNAVIARAQVGSGR